MGEFGRKQIIKLGCEEYFCRVRYWALIEQSHTYKNMNTIYSITEYISFLKSFFVVGKTSNFVCFKFQRHFLRDKSLLKKRTNLKSYFHSIGFQQQMIRDIPWGTKTSLKTQNI
jgi:hypothetical protein